MRRILYWIEKIIYLIISFVVVVFLLSTFKIWSFDRNDYFFKTGNIESIIVVIAITTFVTLLLERLWKWQVREIFKPRRRRR